ncbi:MAG: anhydro-N-acetylmuramic acid kinase [Gammaproteobacteria bacterium]|nr:anhydro-N-acetylmuramic acid kinase [Gammaproteobacteria bacterium]
MTASFIGLMSGTSTDGIDAVLVTFDNDRPHIHATHHLAYDDEFRRRLLAAMQGERDDLDSVATLDVELGRLLSLACREIAQQASMPVSAISAIGSHGHTVRHRPDSQPPFTVQIGDPHIIAKSTGVTTVADFRRADIALGGQGAPLAPAFHAACFTAGEPRAVVNIGGIANVTLLPPAGEVRGYDAGPGNALMDEWISAHLSVPFDRDGHWGAGGQVNQPLLARLLSDEYFNRPAPKSTGRELFNQQWLAAHLGSDSLTAVDVQATLCELTAAAIVDSIAVHAPETAHVLVCGGGVHNAALMQRLTKRSPAPVASTGEFGVDPDWLEAMAFAWFAKRTLDNRAANVPGVTGATRPAVLGAVCPP